MSEGRLQPVSPGTLTAWAVVGLVGGWLLHPLGEWLLGVAPVVSWLQSLLLVLIAAILGGTAWITRRQLQGHGAAVDPHRAVNRLVLARACGLVGALLAGGYLGYAVSWLGLEPDQVLGQRFWRPAAAAVAGIAVLVAARLLEHACRVPPEEDDKP